MKLKQLELEKKREQNKAFKENNRAAVLSKKEENRRKSRDAKGIKNQSDRNKCSQQTPKEWSCSINNESTRVNTLSCGLIRYKGSRAPSDREQSSAPAACC